MRFLLVAWLLLIAACVSCTLSSSETQGIADLIARADSNHDGQLTREELEATGENWAWWWDLALLLTGAVGGRVVERRRSQSAGRDRR